MAMNERARALFELPQRSVGRLLQNLEVSYKPTDLRSLIDEALRDNRVTSQRELEFSPAPGERIYLDLIVTPLRDSSSAAADAAALISFIDVTRHKRLTEELAHFHLELQASQEELQSTGRTGNHQRRAAEHGRRAGDDQRGVAEHQ